MAALPTVGVSPCGNHATAFSLKYFAIVAGSRVANEFAHATAACRNALLSDGWGFVAGAVHRATSVRTRNSRSARSACNVVLPQRRLTDRAQAAAPHCTIHKRNSTLEDGRRQLQA